MVWLRIGYIVIRYKKKGVAAVGRFRDSSVLDVYVKT